MRVALELQSCCGNRSGIGTYTYELARRLKNGDGLEFSGNVFDFPFSPFRKGNLDFLKEVDMPIHIQKSMPYEIYRRIWRLLPLTYGMMFPKADLSVFFNYIVPPRIHGQCITVVYDMTYHRYPETMKKSNLRNLTKNMEYSLERSDGLITISEFSRREIHELLGVPEEKIHVVYCAASLPQRQSTEEQVRARFGIRGPYLLYVGTVEPRKNLRRLLRAYRRLKREENIPHQLVCVGANGWNAQEIYQEAEEFRASGDVVFTGYVSAGDKATLYAGSDAFVFPSLYEGFGMPPLEAMHLGCPVVCANAASLPEIVGEAAELVDPLDDADIARGVWRVLSDREYARSLAEEGRRQAQRFSWERSAEELVKTIKSVAKQ